MRFRTYNVITGWVVFIIASITYLLTIEPTTSFWDCGEFITTAWKLEVGHPPGAPFFMLLGRFFTFFAGGNLEAVAKTMNVLSALASSFTILFLFWSITHLVRKFYPRSDSYSLGDLITILGAGAVGALAYTFSDTFWFSAVEAEVYALSSLFTAVVFWAMLKWENVADEPFANRWLILIAFLMGISIGTHLLNLLTIPALVFIYYFRKYTFSVKGFLAAIGVSLVILGILQAIIIPGIPYVAARFELLFVNGLGLPYYTGVIFYFILMLGLIIFGIYYTHRRGKVFWNTLLLSFFVVVIGYSAYATIIIRSVANTPLDQSNPETMFTLVSYLNREQYGERPLLHGAHFNAKPTGLKKGNPTYYYGEEGYDEIPKDRSYIYPDELEGFFPRMWSHQDKHREEYIYWAKLKRSDLWEVQRDQNGQPQLGRSGEIQYNYNAPKGKPTFVENMRYFVRYQLGHMYFRYFMWNFAGRQNDIQGMGEAHKGNWISGIKFLDEARLGSQDNLPESITNNKAHNKYYLIPFIFGVIGLVFHFRRRPKDAWVVTLLFVLTGIAIVVYLNQYPLQPRERDYAFAGSFYAFTIWIGLGVVAIIEWIKRKVTHVAAPVAVVAISLAIPALMASENWDDHDRSDRYTARAMAKNYLNSTEQGAILYTNGDNDTFPLWYIQEVEDFRTDVRVVNLSYLTADWYIEQMKYRFYDSEPLPIKMGMDKYRSGNIDYAYLVETATALIADKYAYSRERFEEVLLKLHGESVQFLGRSALPTSYPNDYAKFKALGEKMDPLRFYSYLRTFNSPEIIERIGLDGDALKGLVADVEFVIREIDSAPAPLEPAMDFLAGDDPRFGEDRHFIPARKFIIPVDSTQVPEHLFTETVRDYFTDRVEFQLNQEVLYKNALAQLDMIAHNNWQRPIYFSNTVGGDNFLGLDESFVQEGLAYRIAPVKARSSSVYGVIDTKRMYQKLMEEFDWGGLDSHDLYMDENNLRMTIKYRYSFASLARALVQEGENEKAVEVLDHCLEKMPHEKVPYNFAMVPIIQSYLAAGANDKAMEVSNVMRGISTGELAYFTRVIQTKPKRAEKLQGDFLQSLRDLNTLGSMARSFGNEEYAAELDMIVQDYLPIYEQYFRF